MSPRPLSRTPRPPPELTALSAISSMPAASSAATSFISEFDVAADDAVARLHALDRRQRQVRQLGQPPLVDAEKRARGPELWRRYHAMCINNDVLYMYNYIFDRKCQVGSELDGEAVGGGPRVRPARTISGRRALSHAEIVSICKMSGGIVTWPGMAHRRARSIAVAARQVLRFGAHRCGWVSPSPLWGGVAPKAPGWGSAKALELGNATQRNQSTDQAAGAIAATPPDRRRAQALVRAADHEAARVSLPPSGADRSVHRRFRVV